VGERPALSVSLRGPHRPLIGVTISELRRTAAVRPLAESEPPRTELSLGMDYVAAVERAGGLPLVIPPLPADAAEELTAPLAGLLIPGGPDVHPSAYGADADPALGPTEPELDALELAMARAAQARGLPVLGICRGCQVLNVSRGGTLHQHLPDVVDDGARHRQADPIARPTHTVRVVEGSGLARSLGRRRAWVNSLHHQAVDRVGDGLRPVAWALDGIVEGVEAPAGPMALGVQWHAEALPRRPEHAALFAALVDAARETAESSRRRGRAA
jgi:putative glutamine amidotransferase